MEEPTTSTSGDIEPEEYALFTVPGDTRTALVASVLVNGISLTIEVDTGASFTVISKETCTKKFPHCSIQPTDVKLKTYTGESLVVHVHGQFMVSVQYENQKHNLPFIVAGESGPSLLGRNWLYSLRLNWNSIFRLHDSSIEELLQKYSSVFNDELGNTQRVQSKVLYS